MARRRENIFEAARRFAEDLFSGSLFSGGGNGGNGGGKNGDRHEHEDNTGLTSSDQFSPEIKNTLEVMVGKYVNDLLSQQRDLIKMHDQKIESMITAQDTKVRAMISDQDNKVDGRLEKHGRSMKAVLAGASLFSVFVLAASAVIIFASIMKYDRVNRDLAEVRRSQSLMLSEADAAISGLEGELKNMRRENVEILGAVAASVGSGVPGATPSKTEDTKNIGDIQKNLLAMNEKLQKTESEARALRQRLAESDREMQKKFDDMNRTAATAKTAPPDKDKTVATQKQEEPAKSREKESSSAQDWFHAGFAEKDTRKKVELYTKAVEADPKFAMAYNARGNAYADLGRFGLALEDLTKAIELKPMARYYTDRGAVLNMTGDYNLSIRDFEEALNLEPENAAAFNNRGIAFEKKGDTPRALEDYNHAISLDRGMAAAHARKANMLAAAGRKADALKALEASAAAGFNRPDLLDKSLFGGPEFKAVMDKIAANASGKNSR